MENRFLALGKFMVLILALLSPVFFWQSYQNQRELLMRDASFRDALSEEHHEMMERLTYGFFNTPQMLGRAVYRRTLPDGPIQGLDPFPDAETFFSSCGLAVGDTPNVSPELYVMLWDNGSFFSGLPKRYAGLVEITRLSHPRLADRDLERVYSVAEELYRGEGLNNDDFGYLIERMPPEIQSIFQPQWQFLGFRTNDSDGFMVNIRVDDTEYLLALGEANRSQLNRMLDAFDFDYVFMPSSSWLNWTNLRLTLTPQNTPSRPLRQATRLYLFTGGTVVLILAMLYLVLVKYEKVNLAQKKLLATTSHELRTPLAVIRQFSEMLIDRKDHVPQRFRPWHHFIHRESLKMQFLVENLLSAARFEHFASQLAPSQFELKQWFSEIVDSVANLSENRVISLDCPKIQVFWDSAMMSQVLVNILENARIHADSNVDIQVVQQDKRVIIKVRDFGTAVNIQQIRRIQAFKSVDGRKTGLGLGLYLVQRIIASHGGKLNFEEADPGLRVVIHLPERVDA